MHFYIDQETVSNERSGEKFNVSKHRRLLSEESICVNFSEVQKFLSELDFDEMYDIYSNNYQSIRNLLNQLFLINAVVENVKNKYCKYIFIRDDTIVDFTQNSLWKINYWDNRNPRILTTVAHWHGGVCDRFFVLNNTAINCFQYRLEYTLQALTKNKISSEIIFHNFLKNFGFKIYGDFISVKRIRGAKKTIPDRYMFPVHRPYELINVSLAYIRLLVRA